jgi:hypothetical protein
MAESRHVALHRHPAPHRELARRYRYLFARRDFRISALVSTAALAIGWFANYYAIQFATERASNSVTDLVLSNVPVFDVDGLFVYGTFVFAVIGAGIVLLHPKRIPFAMKAVALFWVTRSVFTSLTHLAPFDPHMTSEFGTAVSHLFFGGDLFFSAHTGMPFLGALVFWREKGIRNLFLLASAYFAIIVLLGHLHYSIDVLSAYFITYGIFHIAEWLFPKSRALFYSDVPADA